LYLRSNAVVSVQHARHSIETETVELVLLHPEAQIAKEEAQNFMATVVEQPAVPQLVSTLGTLVEVQVVAVIEHVEAIQYVLRRMTVHHIQQNCNAHTVGSIYQLLQIVWEAVPTACREEAIDLVSETGIVRMLHDCHQLDSVVSQMLNSRKDVLCELLVGGYSWFWRRDSDVSFIDSRALGLGRPLVLPHVFMWGVPEACIVDGRDAEVLSDSGDPGWEAFLAGVVIGDDERYLVGHCQLSS
jgi:hypothetical protein